MRDVSSIGEAEAGTMQKVRVLLIGSHRINTGVLIQDEARHIMRHLQLSNNC